MTEHAPNIIISYVYLVPVTTRRPSHKCLPVNVSQIHPVTYTLYVTHSGHMMMYTPAIIMIIVALVMIIPTLTTLMNIIIIIIAPIIFRCPRSKTHKSAYTS